MNKRTLTSTLSAATAAALIGLAGSARAEDIDLFVNGASSTPADNPNIIFVIDNTANWNRNDSHWVDPNGLIAPYKQGQSELRALKRLIEESNDKVNVGLMLFHRGSPKGTYVRYAVRQMTAANKAALAELIGDETCVDGVGANGTPKCIYKNFSGSEQVPQSASDYSGALFEAFKYFGGCTSPAYAQSDVCKTSPLGTTGFGIERYSNAVTLSASDKIRYDQAAYTNTAKRFYIPPSTSTASCARNYIVFIGNGFPEASADGGVDITAARALMTGVEGNPTQLPMAQFTTIWGPKKDIIGNACSAAGGGLASCTLNIPQSMKDSFPADSYACVGAPLPDSGNLCPATENLYAVEATKNNVATVTPTGGSAVPTTNIRHMDEWARYLFTTDVSAATGVQNLATYTIDVFKDAQSQDQTALLFSAAKYGGGRYFSATSEDQILRAMRDIMSEVQSLNSVFASASLPINATNRSQNENQVFIGMFRPDPSARPRWYGNVKRYQIGKFSEEYRLADASTPPREALSPRTGFLHPCAVSFWTTDTTSYNNSTTPPTDTSYWAFSTTTGHASLCTGTSYSLFSDRPDGPQVEKGATAEVVRLGNDPSTSASYAVNRSVLTCANNGTTVACNIGAALHAFDTTNVSQAAVGAATATEHGRIVNFARGQDVDDDNSRNGFTDVRPSVHGDVAHSRPLPVNYGGSTGVVLYYGGNDGAFRAVSGANGKELWAFVAPEHHGKLKRLLTNDPVISYPPLPFPGSMPKDYFFDGSAGLYQNKDNTKIWVFPSMRRGGRMLYGFDVTSPTSPRLKWRVGCANASLADTASCTSGFQQMGQSWSIPNVALVKGFSTDPESPLVIVGGGYDTCDDQDIAPNTACTATGYTRRGNRVYVINADTGALEKEFTTNGSVAADVTLVDRNFDGFVDHAYVADTLGSIYRIDFVDPINPAVSRVKADWTITEVARTSGDHRKFLFSPAALAAQGKVYLSISSGDRERPLITNYPYASPVVNRAYMFIDKFTTTGLPVDLDDTTWMADLTAGSTCTTAIGTGQLGWFFDLKNGRGEQAVTSSLIFGGLVFFSTNHPDTTPTAACTANLGKAYGYAVNLLNASGAADTMSICGGARSQEFVGGGLPPSPVIGTVPVDGKNVTIMIGATNRGGGLNSPLEGQRGAPTINQRRARVYWYSDSDQ